MWVTHYETVLYIQSRKIQLVIKAQIMLEILNMKILLHYYLVTVIECDVLLTTRDCQSTVIKILTDFHYIIQRPILLKTFVCILDQ